MYKKCEACNGQKKIIGMGCIERDCDVCAGIGQVEKEIKKEIKNEEEVKQKRAYKKRAINNVN